MNNAVALLSQANPWTSSGREAARFTRGTQVEAQKSVAKAELNEFQAQLRKRYTENRMHDAKEVMDLALNLSGGDSLILAGLMEFAGGWMQSEQMIYRAQNAR
ncbi:hypothetical protein QN355_19490 [Cryobacterium sp. 10S3]|uniref:hypothetical protein n=1 Tax=Cryobacterium sp. 10S3 TaxID=3048582 RepID=UPI002AC9399E|nr:hypothetical protein [Cryobacterium sp. 10S3]MEB0288714.1 hypothetical protein [Cryobacterium sp. 10S3]WPX14212.1 hypothetical protein RHM57_02215 [Cryobacterium sp. 10S3]